MKFIAPILILALSPIAYAKSITDDFLSLPHDILPMINDHSGKDFTRAEKLKAIKIKDDKNGYLKIEDPNLISKYTLAQFKTKTGDTLLAITEEGMSVEKFEVYQFKGDHWLQVTSQVIPDLNHDKVLPYFQKKFPKKKDLFSDSSYLGQYAGSVIHYELPRNGTTIEVKSAIDEPGIYGVKLLTLKFNREKFEVSEK